MKVYIEFSLCLVLGKLEIKYKGKTKRKNRRKEKKP